MDSFTVGLKRMSEVLKRSKDTEKDHSLKDAKMVLEGMDNPPKIHLEEIDRFPMRDISMHVKWETHSVRVLLVASSRYFAMRNGAVLINEKPTDWCWCSDYDGFTCVSTEEQRYALWLFLTAITDVL